MWPNQFNGSGFNPDNPPRSEREQGVALIGLNTQGGMSETLGHALVGYSDEHMYFHYPDYDPLAPREAVRPAVCTSFPGLCTCGRCPEGQGYTRGIPPGAGLPIRLPNPDFPYLSKLVEQAIPPPKPDWPGDANLGPTRPTAWKNFARLPPIREGDIPPKPPRSIWYGLGAGRFGSIRPFGHEPYCPHSGGFMPGFWCQCGADQNGMRCAIYGVDPKLTGFR